MAQDYQTCYCGFDPTASSLHIGNLLALIALIHCQRKGHTPIVLIGSATAIIGDPSGKTTDRQAMASNEIVENSTSIQNNVLQIFKNHEKYFWNKHNKSELPQLK
jgi:tyrosyl-tRNA synthetase